MTYQSDRNTFFSLASLGQVLFGTGRDDSLIGTSRNDALFGLNGNDRIEGSGGSDLIDGGRGFDTAIYSGKVVDYDIDVFGGFAGSIRVASVAATVIDPGTDFLTRMEALYFKADDYMLYLDGTNNAVLADNDTVAGAENGVFTLSAAALLANDQEFDDQTIRITAVSSSAAGATVTLSGSAITYDPGSLFDSLAEGETATDTFTYIVDDGFGGTDTATVTVTITGSNDAPVLTLPLAATIDENTTTVASASASDVDSATLTFSLTGDDASLFVVDQSTGAISFIEAPDFETPADTGADNVYNVTVGVSDGAVTATSDLAVTVGDVVETPTFSARLNEFHYDNAGSDVGEFIEVRTTAGGDASGLLVELYNGSGGAVYGTLTTATATVTTDDTHDYYVWNLPANGLQNGAPDGIALSNDGTLVEFLSYEGSFSAVDGAAEGTISTSIGVAESGTDAPGLSLQRNDDGTWRAPETSTSGTANGGVIVPPTELLISEIQGSGSSSSRVGETVAVTAAVTYITTDGFYLQEEDADADADALTSEGIFVFTGGGIAVALSDVVSLTGIVGEAFGLTQITGATNITTISTDAAQPGAVTVMLDPEIVQNCEAIEGMRVSVISGNADPLTIIENFNLDRFGEVTIGAGAQTQPTQLYDAQTEAAEIAALTAANANARLLLDDGNSAQNPDAFEFLPANSGDNGNGFLDSGDNFGNDGATVRLGAELSAPVEGVMGFGFGDYRVIVSEQLDIDEATNGGARQDTPDDVGGTLQVASVNVLNYFSTLVGTGTSGPNGLPPRGANTPEELERQTTKLVESITGTGAEVLALQEMENNGFGEGSGIDTLLDALNADAVASGSGAVYAAVDPTGTGGFVGTDAIMAAIIYDSSAVTLTQSALVTYDEPSAAQTFALAEVLNPFVPASARLQDFDRNRPSVVATFTDNATGESFTVVSSHFKSKGDSGLVALANAAQAYIDGRGTGTTQDDVDALRADPNFDQGNGQASWNAVRLDAATQLADFMANDYDAPGGYLLLGDFNSYAEDDPVQYLDDTAGLTDLIDTYVGQENAYSFVFDGQRGTLDQGFASDDIAGFVTGATEWHINADEPDLIGYDTSSKAPNFFNDGPYGSADHDPLIVGLDLGGGAVLV
jgi:uncharacterized protein